MKIKSLIAFIAVIALSFLSFTLLLPEEKDFLHKRIFNITHVEIKDGVPQKKTVTDKIEFKNGKMYSNFLGEKFDFKWIKYRINKDSIFTDSTDTEVRYLEVEATATDENNQTVMMNFNVLEWDIEGVLKITKNDKLKKHFDFIGREKGGKPKKDKKKKPETMRMEGEPEVPEKK